MKANILIVTILFLVLNFTAWAYAQTQPPTVYEMEEKSTTIVLENGDAQVKEVISVSAAGFRIFKQRFPMLSMYARLFKPMNQPIDIEDLKIDVDEANNNITASYTIRGASVNKGDHWEITVAPEGQKVTLTAQSGNSLVFTFIGQVTQEFRAIVTVTVTLPEQAGNIRFDRSTNKINYELPQKKAVAIGGNPIFLITAGICMALAASNQVLARRKAQPPTPA